MFFMSRAKSEMVSPENALKGRDQAIPTEKMHFVLDTPIHDVPEGHAGGDLRHGLFLGRRADVLEAAGRLTDGGRLCRRLHAQPDLSRRSAPATPATPRWCGSSSIPTKISYDDLLKVFWESHDPTQGMRQGNDVGTQYRSGIYCHDAGAAARRPRPAARRLPAAPEGGGLRRRSPPRSSTRRTFYFAEDYHQQYLAKNPDGYCGIGGTGVTCPIGVNA